MDNPEAKFFEAYGRAMAKWADFELNLAHLFERVTDMHHTVAVRVFFSSKSSRARFDMLGEALPAQAAHPSTVAAIQDLIERGRQFNETRNRLAHEFTWMRTDYEQMTAEHVLVKPPRLLDIRTRSQSLENAISTKNLLEIRENLSKLTEVAARLYSLFDHPELHEELRATIAAIPKRPYTQDRPNTPPIRPRPHQPSDP
jgi:muconolactone delta-isomerase